MPASNKLKTRLLTFLTCAAACVSLAAQTPPAHPRLLFNASEVPAVLAKVTAPQTMSSSAFALCASSVALQVAGALPSESNQTAFVVMRSLRRMTEVASRYAILGDANAGANAKAMLLDVVTKLVPTGNTPYQTSSYPCAMALTFDLIHPLLTPAQRIQVVQHLEAWVNAMKLASSPVAGYAGYAGAADNYSFAWCTGIAFTLLGIWGDSTYPNLVSEVQSNMAKLQSGWMDVVSPDGSIDESYGYASYGIVYSLNAGIAAQKCGLGDYLQGTNILKSAKWLTSSLFGNQFVWIGDSSPAHKGERMDPVIWHVVRRTQDAQSLWGLSRVFLVEPLSDNLTSQAFSPYLNAALHYPEGLVPATPPVLSAFFRDNLNQGTPSGNKTTNYAGVGLGGSMFFHNSSSAASTQLGGLYTIRDEWMNHGHEDDGHFSLISDGCHFYVDVGYAAGNFAGAQSTDHNIVVASGVPGFNGDATNYYTPPSPNGRFLGSKAASLIGPSADYVRGSHGNMWMMQEASRTVLMIKDPVRPYFILADRVNKDGTSRTYEEVFHSVAPASGNGSALSPLTLTCNGATLRATWLAPSSPTVTPGSAASSATGIIYRHKVSAQGTAVNFVSVHGKTALSGVAPLQSALPGTSGGVVSMPGSDDKILVNTSSGTIGDALTRTDARTAWLRSTNGVLGAFIVGEGTSLVHAGKSLLVASAPVVVVAKDGRVDVASVATVAGAPLGLVVRIPFQATVVTVDGVSVPFTQVLDRITLGPAPVPPASVEDRLYTFDEGQLGDGILEGPAILVQGSLGSVFGQAGLRLRGGQAQAPRPVAVSLSADFLTGAGTSAAGLVFETIAGSANLFRVGLSPGSATMAEASVFSGSGAPLSSIALPATLSGDVRVGVVFRPLTGTIELLDAVGAVRASVAITPPAGGFFVRALVTDRALIDNVTFFASDEDGVTPEGIAVVGLPSGRVGYAIHAPSLLLLQDSGLWHNGQRLDAQFATAWFQNSGIHEVAVTPFLNFVAALPLSIREVVFKTAQVSVFTTSGSRFGVSIVSALGQELYGSYVY